MAALAEPILGSVDTICIGRLGVIPMAAMTPNNTVFNMLNTLASLTMSVTVVSKMSAAIGAGRRRVDAESSSDEKKNQSNMMSTDSAFDVGATSALVLGIVSAAAFLLLPEFCLTATGASIETLAPAKSYFVIRALGVPVFLFTMVLNAAYTAALDLRTPLLNVVGAGLLNAVLDMLFIFGFGCVTPIVHPPPLI
jgi:Na+-driven multidrug efflux pump